MLPPIYTTPPPIEAPVLSSEMTVAQGEPQNEEAISHAKQEESNSQAKPTQKEITVDDALHIRANTISDDLVEGKLICEGEVELNYGLTKLKANRIVLDRTEQKGTAEGLVQIIDPEGVIQCSDLEFFWKDAGSDADISEDRLVATGKNAFIKIDRVLIQAATLEIIERMPDRTPEWILGEVKFSFTDMEPRGTRFRARTIRLYPGKYGLAVKPVLTSLDGASAPSRNTLSTSISVSADSNSLASPTAAEPASGSPGIPPSSSMTKPVLAPPLTYSPASARAENSSSPTAPSTPRKTHSPSNPAPTSTSDTADPGLKTSSSMTLKHISPS
ncbi:MAG: hypothetical protein R2688_01370 [Fimbriimonadaceae bacterium]